MNLDLFPRNGTRPSGSVAACSLQPKAQAGFVCTIAGNLLRVSFLRSTFWLALSMSMPTKSPSAS